jgi:hypothetical protein
MRFKYFTFFFSLWIALIGNCQEAKLSEAIESIAEELAADDSNNEEVATYTEKLFELAEDPVNLNSTDEDELSRLFFLTSFQVKALADYSRSSGKILSVYEIAAIPGFDRETTEMMIPFIIFREDSSPHLKHSPFRHTLLTNITSKPGAKDTTSSGSPLKVLSKYRFSAGGFSGGFTIEKDPGEKFSSGKPDFISSHLAYKGSGLIRRIIIGDFSARFGQGTNTNTGIRTGLSLTAPGYMAARSEIRQYTSTDENSFFRGMAAEFSIRNLLFSAYYSKNRIDATMNSDGSESITNFYTSGLHNTPSLMLKKDVVTDLAYGINLSYSFSKTRIGAVWSEDRLSFPVINEDPDPEEAFDFEGDRNSLYTIYYNSLLNRILLYGEITVNQSCKHAMVQGVSMRLSDRLTINGLFRNYEKGFYSINGKGPGSSSPAWNESSILGNFTFEAAKHLFISAGCDFRNYPWLRYRNSAPSRAIRQEVGAKYLPYANLTIEALCNFSFSMHDDPESTFIPLQEELRTKYARVSVRYSPVENLKLGTRADYKIVKPSGSKGVLLLQDVSYAFRKIPLTCWFRYCFFSTEDWDSRIYTYENDLLYSFSIPALSGVGSRSYFMLKYEIGETAEIRFKYGITSISELNIPLNKEEVKFQMRIFF